MTDLALEWGACATLTDDDGVVVIELEHSDSTVHLDLGPASQLYADLLCRALLFVPSAPHRFCDRWNRFPYYGAFSVVYDENDFPQRSEAGFAVRAVKLIEFVRCRRQEDIFLEIMMFWYAIELMKKGLANGETDIAQFAARREEDGFIKWCRGDA